MRILTAWAAFASLCLWATLGAAPARAGSETLAAQVREREIAFAKTMVDRDLEAFASFVAEDAVFLGHQGPLHGRDAIVEEWRPRYEGLKAPFSWAPEIVEVVGPGDLALSRGPIFDPEGQRVGTYISTWRRDSDGQWRVVIDSGCPACPEPQGP